MIPFSQSQAPFAAATFVHLAGAETVAGAKTFADTAAFSNGLTGTNCTFSGTGNFNSVYATSGVVITGASGGIILQARDQTSGSTTTYNPDGSWRVFAGGDRLIVGATGLVTVPGTLSVGSASGIVKQTSGLFGTATAGTDYLAPAGSGAALTGITASQVGSVPAGVLKGSGGAFAAATAGTDYLTPTGSGASLTGLTQGQITGLKTTDSPTFANATVTTTLNALNVYSTNGVVITGSSGGIIVQPRGGTGSNVTLYNPSGTDWRVFIGADVWKVDTSGNVTMYGVTVLKSYTVSTLPASPGAGATAFVTDATTPTWGGTLTGGGTTKTPVYYDGSAWRAG